MDIYCLPTLHCLRIANVIVIGKFIDKKITVLLLLKLKRIVYLILEKMKIFLPE
jgi:hypothetical protein